MRRWKGIDEEKKTRKANKANEREKKDRNVVTNRQKEGTKVKEERDMERR